MRLIDTNVLVRYLANDDPRQSATSRALFRRLEDGAEHVELVLPVLFEVVYVLQKVYKVKRPAIVEALTSLLALATVNIQNKQMILRMLEYWGASNLGLTDCYLVALMENTKRSEIYSFDRDFDRFHFVRRIEPHR